MSWLPETALLTVSNDIPNSFSDAPSSPNIDAWKAAMQNEYDFLREHDPGNLVFSPAEQNNVSSKCVFAQMFEAPVS